MEPQRDTPMLKILLDHSPAFVVGELILALCLGTFVLALMGTMRERYSIKITLPRIRGQSPR
jgi:ABC-type transport system involved in cytochrome c biogenesis permease component